VKVIAPVLVVPAMPWSLIVFTALVCAAWFGALVWLARGFRRGKLLDPAEAPRNPPRSNFRA